MNNLFLSIIISIGMSNVQNPSQIQHFPLIESIDSEDEIAKVIHTMFDGMRKGDSAMVRSVFSSSAQLFSIGIRDGSPILHQGSLTNFTNAVGTPHDQVWDERIGIPEIKVDGPMAIAWVPYAFYLGENFSHCGVNTFTFLQENNEWKIINITDTRRKEDCPDL